MNAIIWYLRNNAKWSLLDSQPPIQGRQHLSRKTILRIAYQQKCEDGDPPHDCKYFVSLSSTSALQYQPPTTETTKIGTASVFILLQSEHLFRLKMPASLLIMFIGRITKKKKKNKRNEIIVPDSPYHAVPNAAAFHRYIDQFQ